MTAIEIHTGDRPTPIHRTFDVGIDIDDVIARWYEDSHSVCLRAGITNGVTPTTWRPYEEYGCSDQDWFDVLHKALVDGYLLRMRTYPGATDSLHRLAFDGHRVHLITARGFFQDGDLIRRHTQQWLARLYVPYTSLEFTEDKAQVAALLDLDYFIDDQPRNIDSVREVSDSTRCYLVDRPWNQDSSVAERVASLQEFTDLVIQEGRRPNE